MRSLPVRMATQHKPAGSSLRRVSIEREVNPLFGENFRVKFDTARRNAQSGLQSIWDYIACSCGDSCPVNTKMLGLVEVHRISRNRGK